MSGEDRARELRLAFDASFAAAPEEGRVAHVELLTIRAGDELLALRLDGLRGLFVDKVVTALPSPIAELVGVAGFRGEVVPVFDLGALIGAGATRERLRYLVLVAHGDELVGFAFSGFDGHERLAPQDVAVRAKGGNDAETAGGEHLRELASEGGVTRAVVDLRALMASLRARAGRADLGTRNG